MVVAFVVVVAAAVLLRRRRQDSLRRKVFEKEIKRAQQVVHDEMVQRFGYDKALSSRYESLKVNLSQITLGHEIGRGAFGIVMLGDLEREGKMQRVAVKQLNTDVGSEEQSTFLYECRLLAMLEHPYIIRIVAVQVDARPVLLLTEYMKLGSLVHVLRETPASSVSQDKLYNILARVADACAYLVSHNIVHRVSWVVRGGSWCWEFARASGEEDVKRGTKQSLKREGGVCVCVCVCAQACVVHVMTLVVDLLIVDWLVGCLLAAMRAYACPLLSACVNSLLLCL